MRKTFRGFTLIELLVVIAIIALLISILLPSLSRARELSKRLVCGSNTKGIGTSCKIYANDNNERWPIPAYNQTKARENGIDYRAESNTDPPEAGAVGFNRWLQSTSNTALQQQGSTAVSVTRSFWMLVRSGDVTVKQFICPSSGDQEDPTDDLDTYYDFTRYENVSYGYQVPFGPRDTQPREGMDNRQAMLADKGPFYLSSTGNPTWRDSGGQNELTLDSSPKEWRRYNSGNHGGAANGEGQNVLFADGHSSFHRTPTAGIDGDNIYTLMTQDWALDRFNMIHGETVHEASAADNPHPGQEALGDGAYSSTDALIYP